MVLAKNISVEFPAVRDRKGYRSRRVISVMVESGWEKLTDTCEITLSRNLKGLDLAQVRDLFRRGDTVKVFAGYNKKLLQEFEGYITDVSDEKHLVFKCQDEMYKLKTGSVNFNKKNCKLLDILKAIAPGYTLDAVDAELGSVRIKGMSPAEVLLKLKDQYGLYCFFRGTTLVAGKIYQGNSNKLKLNFDRLRNIKTHSLTYKRAEDIHVKVKVTSILSNGTKIEATAGDENGSVSEINLYGIKSKADLQKKADEKLALMKADGYTGSVTLFGIPKIVHGDEVDLKSERYPERNGTYHVDATTYQYGPGATIERSVKIGNKI